MMFKDIDIGLFLNPACQRARYRLPSSICGMEDAPMTVTALLGQMEIIVVGILTTSGPLLDKPLQRGGALF